MLRIAPKHSKYSTSWASLVPQTVKYLPALQETQVQSLGGEDPLEKGMATHISFLAWRIPWTEEPGGLQSIGVTKNQIPLSNKHFHFPFFFPFNYLALLIRS